MESRSVATQDGRLFSRLGISGNGEALWHLLLSEPSISPANLRRSLHMSTPELDDTMAELIEADLLRERDAPSGVEAIDPALAIEAHLARAERKMAEQAADFAAIRSAIPTLTRQYSDNRLTADAAPALEVVVPRDDIQRQINLAAEQVAHEIRTFDCLPSAHTKNEFDRQVDTLARGVRDRVVMPPGALSLPGVFDTYLQLQERGHDARTHVSVATRLFIFDRKLAVLPIDNERIELGAVFVRLRSLIDGLIMMYEAMWEVSTPIFSSSVDGGAPIGRHARILELLVLGNKDEAISRSLKIGVRTIRRDVADLKELLGVSSRTEIAAAAVRKGWL